MTKTNFVRPADFSPERYFANALGVVPGTENHHVRIRFSATAADRVRERVWHESQSVQELSGGAIELSLRLGTLTEVERWVLGWGELAEVLAPASLRARLRAVAEGVAGIYASTS